MNDEIKQPKEYDLVLGGNNPPPLDSLVLGGIEGVRQRLSSESEEVMIAAIKDAINYGQEGEDLLFQILTNYFEQNTKGHGIMLWQCFSYLWEKRDRYNDQDLTKYLPMLLKKSRKQWNKWREQYPETRLDFRQVQWKKVKLESVNLSNINFSASDFTAANLSKSNLSKTNLFSSKLFWTNLSNSNLANTKLTRVELDQANLRKADLSDANCNDASIYCCNFSNSNLTNVNFQESRISHCDFRGANLTNTDFRRAKLCNVKLDDNALKNANTTDTIIEQQDRYYEASYE